MNAETFIALRAAELSPAKQEALLKMQDPHGRRFNIFSPADLARLSFARWLYQTGWLTS